MEEVQSMLPEIPVRFVYLGPDGEEHLDTQFDAICVSAPRIGETVLPAAGSKKVIVHNVYHRFIKNEAMDSQRFVQYITVVLKELPPQEQQERA
jgi:hypothetical protein